MRTTKAEPRFSGLKKLKFVKRSKKTAKTKIKVKKEELPLLAKPRFTSKPQNSKNRRLSWGRVHQTWAVSEVGCWAEAKTTAKDKNNNQHGAVLSQNGVWSTQRFSEYALVQQVLLPRAMPLTHGAVLVQYLTSS
ncbi:hypothetical protein HanHA300_Chr04g0133461 [Helianthus annuus]|nr:hypothetical protein HanHA300_Chr04g0133461 [Helianthus annuus]